MEYVTDIYSLNCQLSSDTKHFLFIFCKKDGNLQSCGFWHLNDL